MPVAPGRHPAVLMLGGSGPVDRDETIGRNKPFKDIAWGLATAGVASLRFDKVKPARPDFTLDDEYVRPALAAAEELRQQGEVDPARIFVLGHSLGGTVAPRVAAAFESAGIVLLAAGAQPMYWAAVRQVRYLASLNPDGAAASQPIIDALTAQARAVDDLSPGTVATTLPFGAPASYWKDVRDYDACATAAALGKPALVLQGARDYQSTVDDDLALWRAALPDATVRVYDADNHLFFAGEGPSNPSEYEAAQHVDPAVIADIAAWVSQVTS